MAVRYNTVHWYGPSQFLLRSTVRLFSKVTGTGTFVRYAFLVMVRVRYVGTLFEFVYLTFYEQRAAVNEDSCDRTRRADML